tara:strand:- start:772 stop:906 length:135 start_codon:yes stop_codon:yes gene_type:complete
LLSEVIQILPPHRKEAKHHRYEAYHHRKEAKHNRYEAYHHRKEA